MCIKEEGNSEGLISSDTDINGNKDCDFEKRGVDMRVEYTSGSSDGISGLLEDTLSDSSKDRMVFFRVFFLPKRSLYQILDRNDFLVKVIIIKNIYVLIAGGSRK